MGKFMRKAKLTGTDIALTEISSQSSFGVRTRAKTLALQRRLHSSAVAPPPIQSSFGVRTRAETLALQRRLQSSAVSPPPSKPDSCYLELRSRRLEKPPLVKQQSSRKLSSSSQKARSGSGLNSIVRGEFEIGETEIEASFGENNLDLEARGRSTRESTPCSFIRAAETITTPSSSTKQRIPIAVDQSAQSAPSRNIPTAHDLEEFFAHEEESQQRLFIEKYNFDVVNDLPLPGRYEWVKVKP